MGLFDERIAYKPFEYPEYYTEGWLKQAQAFWLHTEIPMQSDVKDWKEKLEKRLGKYVVELTGDVTPDMRAIQRAQVIVTTPEKWDGISRSWQTRNYVQAVRLIVIDEIHLLGEDRGPVLEVIVSRTNFISSHTSRKLRIIGLSTALANAKDLADRLTLEYNKARQAAITTEILEIVGGSEALKG